MHRIASGNDGVRVVFLTDRYMPHSGGARVYYHNLYSRMIEQFPDTIRILTKKVPGWQEFDRNHQNRSLQIRRCGTPLPNWKLEHLPKILPPLAHALAHCASDPPDQIHFGDLFPPGLISLAFRTFLHIPYLAYCHGDENSQVDQRRYQPMVRDRIYRNAAAVIAANEYARQGLLRIGVSDSRIHKITPGLDLDQFRPGPADSTLVRQLGLNGKIVLLTAVW
jgi:phosphatidylinositol alpha-1,6-mannosyltransferase